MEHLENPRLVQPDTVCEHLGADGTGGVEPGERGDHEGHLVDAEAAADADGFLTSRGYILRRVTSYGFPNALRLTVGSEEASRGVVATLAQFLDAQAPT